MTPADLQSIAAAVYGARWQSQLSRDMGVGLRTVQRWARDGIDKSATSEWVRRFLEDRRIARLPGPPAGTTPDDDRDAACYEAVAPSVEAIIAAARDVGWGEAETLTAILSIAIDGMIGAAGESATAETLEMAILAIRDEPPER